LREIPSAAVVSANGNGAAEPLRAVPEPDFDPSATSLHDANERQMVPAAGVPQSFSEVDLDDVRGIIWDKVTTLPVDRRHEPTRRELEILAALWAHRFLFAGQIWRRWWPDSSQRAAQQGLNRMAAAGWVRRFKFQVAERGAQPRVYCLTRAGFELAQQRTGRHGPYVNADDTWREPQIGDPRRVMRDLHVNGWVLALMAMHPKAVGRWRGPRESRLDPPRRRDHGEWVALGPADVVVGTNSRLRDLKVRTFEPVSPDAILELRVRTSDPVIRLDLLIDLDRARSSASTEQRLTRYDAFLTGWARSQARYDHAGVIPTVVFVCEDEPSCLKLVRLADRVVTGRIAKAGTAETEWPFPGRRALFFAAERDVHMGSLQAFALPEHPPEVRVTLGGTRDRACAPRRVHIVEPRLLSAVRAAAVG
jgi:hypothetical protein